MYSAVGMYGYLQVPEALLASVVAPSLILIGGTDLL
jgi:hypothetical protein